jgi:hypothetical protein
MNAKNKNIQLLKTSNMKGIKKIIYECKEKNKRDEIDPKEVIGRRTGKKVIKIIDYKENIQQGSGQDGLFSWKMDHTCSGSICYKVLLEDNTEAKMLLGFCQDETGHGSAPPHFNNYIAVLGTDRNQINRNEDIQDSRRLATHMIGSQYQYSVTIVFEDAKTPSQTFAIKYKKANPTIVSSSGCEPV